tara:strand:- start:50 stop:721 length:672 start_codon:yes stop_codon:yes gene_type:complete
MDTLLSTKKLKRNQQELILNAGFSFVEYDAIHIKLKDFEIPEDLKNALFTSKNAVKAFFHCGGLENKEINCFCVGPKTEALLNENGFNITKSAENAADLGEFIVKNFKNEDFYFFCGNKRRGELPITLAENKVSLTEVEVYKTALNSKKFSQKFEAVLFFSPTGVQSFAELNSWEALLAVCIGETTASEAKKHTSNVAIANSTTIESVIAKAVKTIKNYDRKN